MTLIKQHDESGKRTHLGLGLMILLTAALLEGVAATAGSQAPADAGKTNTVLPQGAATNARPGLSSFFAGIPYTLRGTVRDPNGQPASGALLAMFPLQGIRWTRAGADGAFALTVEGWLTGFGTGQLIARDTNRNLALIEDLSTDITNVDLKLKPALTLTGRVQDAEGKPIAGAQVSWLFKRGNNDAFLNEESIATDAQGRYELRCVPVDGQYSVLVSIKGYGPNRLSVSPDWETNRTELAPVILKRADRVLAGKVMDEIGMPQPEAEVSLSGAEQPDLSMTTDSQGRFQFELCDGAVELRVRSQFGLARFQAEAGNTNVLVTLIEPAGVKRITCVVHFPDGRPASGLPVRVVVNKGPSSGATTDANGRFDARIARGEVSTIFVRDAEQNLAVGVAWDIGFDTGPLDLTLKPGLTVVGRADRR